MSLTISTRPVDVAGGTCTEKQFEENFTLYYEVLMAAAKTKRSQFDLEANPLGACLRSETKRTRIFKLNSNRHRRPADALRAPPSAPPLIRANPAGSDGRRAHQ